MTLAPDAPRLEFADLDGAIRVLRDSGLRLSMPRRLILEALFAADGPVSAASLARELGLDESSVYRNLEVLEQRGVVRHVHLGHSAGLYLLVGDERLEYLYCERCGSVTAVSPEQLDDVREAIRARFGHAARFAHFPIAGTCGECASGSSGTSQSTG